MIDVMRDTARILSVYQPSEDVRERLFSLLEIPSFQLFSVAVLMLAEARVEVTLESVQIMAIGIMDLEMMSFPLSDLPQYFHESWPRVLLAWRETSNLDLLCFFRLLLLKTELKVDGWLLVAQVAEFVGTLPFLNLAVASLDAADSLCGLCIALARSAGVRQSAVSFRNRLSSFRGRIVLPSVAARTRAAMILAQRFTAEPIAVDRRIDDLLLEE